MADYRLRYKKTGRLRFISHLDLLRLVERAMRRADLRIIFTQGFHPHPRLSFGPALPVGFESIDEYLDISLQVGISPVEVRERMNKGLPDGFQILDVAEIINKVKPLTAVINQAEYTFEETSLITEEIYPELQLLWEKENIEIERRSKGGGGKNINIRPFWHQWKLHEGEKGPSLKITVEVGNKGSIRPDEFLGLLSDKVAFHKGTRTHLWVCDGNIRVSPMELC